MSKTIEKDKLIIKWVNFMFGLDYVKIEEIPEDFLMRAKAHSDRGLTNALIYHGVKKGQQSGVITRMLKVSRTRLKNVKDAM